MTGAPYRPPLPASSAHVVWPADFGQRFLITIDTEEEFDWSVAFARENTAVTAAAALPDAVRHLSDGGGIAALLIDHPIAADAAAIDALHRAVDGTRHAIGAQLHPWVNPPFEEALSDTNSFPGNLPPQIEAAKLDELTRLIADEFGAPRTYRAGRYGIGPSTLRLLAERGYRFDTSIRPGYDYRRGGGPDFTYHDNRAFRDGPDDGVVELPLTTIFTGRLRNAGPTIHRLSGIVPKMRGVLARTGLVSRVSLTPEGIPLAEAMEAIRIGAGEGLAFLNLSFHSPSLVAGHTPYVRDAADLAAFWRWWDGVLTLLARLDIRAASVDDLLAATA